MGALSDCGGVGCGFVAMGVQGALEVVIALIERGADCNIVNNDQEGPVHWACSGILGIRA